MTFWTRLRNAFKTSPGAIPVGQGSLPAWLQGRGLNDPYLYAPVSRCINLLSKDAARLIVKTLATVDAEGYMTEGRAKEARNLLLRRSVDRGRSDAFAFWKGVFVDLLREGNAYIVPSFSADRLTGLRRLDPTTVRWDEPSLSFEGRYEDTPTGEIVRLNERRIIHCLFSPEKQADHKLAVSPIESIAQVVATGIALDGRLREHVEKGPNRFAMTFDDPVTEDQMKEIIEAIKGYGKTNHPLLVNAKAGIHDIRDRIMDGDLANFQTRLVRMTAMVFGIPPAILGEGTSAAKVESLLREYWKGLGQILDDVLEPLSHRLLPATNSFVVTPAHLVRGDFASGVAAARAMFPNTGSPHLATLREGRDLFLLSPITRAGEAALKEQGALPPPEPESTNTPGQPDQPQPGG